MTSKRIVCRCQMLAQDLNIIAKIKRYCMDINSNNINTKTVKITLPFLLIEIKFLYISSQVHVTTYFYF